MRGIPETRDEGAGDRTGGTPQPRMTPQEERGPAWLRVLPSSPPVVQIAVVLVAGLAGAAVAIVVLAQPAEIAVERASPTPRSTTSTSLPPSDQPTEDVAGSSGLVDDFDRLAIGADIDGWTLTDAATIDVAARPSAVDRSLRLSADADGRACRELDVAIGAVTADFMLDALPSDGVPVLTLELVDETALTLTVYDGAVTLADSTSSAPIEPHAWYRWTVVAEEGEGRMTLLGPGDTWLAEASIPVPEAHATRFCLTTAGPARAYLDTLTVEAR